MSELSKTSIAALCAPAAGPAHQQLQQLEQPGIWSLTQMGSGMAGKDSRTLVCWPERLSDNQGNFQGETIHPVIGDLQTDSRIAASLREIEIRAAITTDRIPGLIYRKLPYATGVPNSWIISGKTVMDALVEGCGRARSDHNAGSYYFEPLNGATEFASFMPDVDIMIDKLLADYVIDSPDHPTLQRLLNPGQQDSSAQFGNIIADLDDEGDDEVY